MDQSQYEQQLGQFVTEAIAKRPEFENRFYRYPILNDDIPNTTFDEHYIYHVAWALRKLAKSQPSQHIDFGSSLAFSTAAAAFTPTTFVDIRPPNLRIEGLNLIKGDLANLDKTFGACKSVSCLHVLEHIGLGRYGDTLDVNGDLKAVECLKGAVEPGGKLYFAVPVGEPSISFNAHRVYSAEEVFGWFSKEFFLVEFYFIPANGKDSPFVLADLSKTRDYKYGCGCFELVRCP